MQKTGISAELKLDNAAFVQRLRQTKDDLKGFTSQVNSIKLKPLPIPPIPDRTISSLRTWTDLNQQALKDMKRTSDAVNSLAGQGGYGRGQGLLQLGQTLDDAQYGIRGVVNNLAPLLQGMGMGAGVAGVVTVAAVAVNQLSESWDKLTGAQKRAADSAEAAMRVNAATAQAIGQEAGPASKTAEMRGNRPGDYAKAYQLQDLQNRSVNEARDLEEKLAKIKIQNLDASKRIVVEAELEKKTAKERIDLELKTVEQRLDGQRTMRTRAQETLKTMEAELAVLDEQASKRQVENQVRDARLTAGETGMSSEQLGATKAAMAVGDAEGIAAKIERFGGKDIADVFRDMAAAAKQELQDEKRAVLQQRIIGEKKAVEGFAGLEEQFSGRKTELEGQRANLPLHETVIDKQAQQALDTIKVDAFFKRISQGFDDAMMGVGEWLRQFNHVEKLQQEALDREKQLADFRKTLTINELRSTGRRGDTRRADRMQAESEDKFRQENLIKEGFKPREAEDITRRERAIKERQRDRGKPGKITGATQDLRKTGLDGDFATNFDALNAAAMAPRMGVQTADRTTLNNERGRQKEKLAKENRTAFASDAPGQTAGLLREILNAIRGNAEKRTAPRKTN